MDQIPDPLHNIQQYYGSTIQSRADLCTTACSLDHDSEVSRASHLVRQARSRVHQQVQDRFYGCGSPIPPAVDGLVVLDMGCGSGRDCYMLSQLVGPRGRVIGVDLSAEQIDVARRHVDWHAQQFGYANVDFRHGRMEDLTTLDITDSSIDVVVSNCVLNLSLEKARIFREIFRVLKPGGELYFSDIFSDRRLPGDLIQDPILHGECLAGAWYREDLRRMLAANGCADLRMMSSRPITIRNQDVADKIGFVAFTSCTIRAFKMESLEDRCEDFGQVAMYRGTVDGYPHAFPLDADHSFPRGKRVPVCGNTADMLTASRFAPFFDVLGDKSIHYGLLPCSGPSSPDTVLDADVRRNGACC